MPVILSEAKDLAHGTQRSFASLRMTGRTTFKSAHGASSLQTSVSGAVIGIGMASLALGVVSLGIGLFTA
jgi:hypothetical protein